MSGAQWDGVNVGNRSVAFGEDNIASGAYSAAFGHENDVSGLSSFSLGNNNEVSGSNAAALGPLNTISANGGIGIGIYQTISGIQSISLGRSVNTSGARSVTIGSGVSQLSPLANGIDDCLMVGFNSNVSTMYVGPPEGEEDYGSVGIGNVTEPTERLDVRGTARFRVMEEAETPDVMVVGMEADEEVGDYVLNYLSFSGNSSDLLTGDRTWIDGSGTVCDWNIVGGGNDLATGYPGACVPGNVGIGNLPPASAKLFVQDELDAPGDIGIEVRTPAIAANTFGVTSTIESISETATHVTGVYGSAINGKAITGGLFEATGNAQLLTQSLVGVFGHAFSVGPVGNGSDSHAIGVYGLGESSVNCDRPIGVYGQGTNTTGCASGYAGYFAGAVVESQQAIYLSDESLKTNIEVIENPLDILLQLNPSSYEFNSELTSSGAFSQGISYGFIAQEVEEVLPSIVASVPSPFILY